MKLLRIGNKCYISQNEIIGIMLPDTKMAKRLILTANEKNKLIDATGRESRRSLVVLQSDRVVLSPISVECLKKNLINGSSIDEE